MRSVTDSWQAHKPRYMSLWGMTKTDRDQRRFCPDVPGKFLLGVLPELRRDPISVLTTAASKGDLVALRVPRQRLYLLNHPRFVKHVLQDNHSRYAKSPLVARLKPLLGEGLLTSEGDLWERQRRLMQPVFQRRQILNSAGIMMDTTAEMLERWQSASEAGAQLDVADEMSRVTLEIFARSMFSTRIDDRVAVIRHAMEKLQECLNQRIWAVVNLPLWLPTPANVGFKRAMRPLDQIVRKIIEERVKDRRRSNDLLQRLLDARDAESGKSMSPRQLRDEVMTMLTAGHETTAAALTWFWYLLATHPEEERRVHDELATVLGGTPPSIEDLPKLSYLQMAIYESLRLFPAVWWFSRVTTQDEVIDGYVIPSGSTLILSQYTMNRHPAFWDNPEIFDPERFSPERSKDRPHYCFFPFGGGPRICIGNNFALLEFQIVAAMVTQRYRLVLPPDHKLDLHPMISLRPRGGLPMNVVMRDDGMKVSL